MNLVLYRRPCPVCGAADARVFAESNLDPDRLNEFAFASRKLPEYMYGRLVECRHCDLLFTDPAPTPETLAAAYRSAAYDSGEESQHAAQTYARFLPGVCARLPERTRALDIGTGDGAFLRELLRAGFEQVCGLEPSAAPVAAADQDIRPYIRPAMFREGLFEAESFDLVTCFQTIEHVSDPLGLCREARRILKPGGVLFLVGHNRRAFSARVLGRKSPIFDIEHLQLFSPASLCRLLDEAGFADVGVAPILNRYPAQYWVRLFPFPRAIKGRLERWLRHSRLGPLKVSLPAGNLAALARKPAAPAPAVASRSGGMVTL
jgi:SAM-dependent methyltransferase